MGPLITTLVGRRLFWAAALAVLVGMPLASGLSRARPPPVSLTGVTAQVELMGAQGEPVGAASLAGRAWVVGFVDPRCPRCATRTLEALETLARHTRQLGPTLGLLAVSLTALPSPEEPPAHPRAWLLAGGPRATALLEQLAQGHQDDTRRLSQGDSLALLDGHLRLRALYSTNPRQTETLLRDISLLMNRDNQLP